MEFVIPLMLGVGLMALFFGESDEDVTAADAPTGTDGNDEVALGDGPDMFSGGEGDDSINGGGGSDSLSGDGGADVLSGDDGDDSIDGGSGNDLIYGGQGFDELSGGAGDDTIQGNLGKDSIDGGDGDDILNGGAWDDALFGGAGRDILFGRPGDDLLVGGNNANSPLNDDPHSVERPDLVERLYGGDGHDILIGGDGEDRLEGGNGNDLLISGDAFEISDEYMALVRQDLIAPTKPLMTMDMDHAPDTDADVLEGGAGDDLFVLDGNDNAFGGSGADTFIVAAPWVPTDGFSTTRVSDLDVDEDVLVIGYDEDDGAPTLTYSRDALGDIVVSADGNAVVTVAANSGITEADLMGVIEILPLAPPDI